MMLSANQIPPFNLFSKSASKLKAKAKTRTFGTDLTNIVAKTEDKATSAVTKETDKAASLISANKSEETTKDPDNVPEGINEIYMNMLERERTMNSAGEYIAFQEFNVNHRAALVNYMAEGQIRLGLHTRTLHLAVNILDRYFETKRLGQYEIMLVGVTALTVAAKFDENTRRRMQEYEKLLNGLYDRAEFLRTELEILANLKYDIFAATPLAFLDIYCVLTNTEPKCRNLAAYFLELTLLDYEMIKYLPSRKATACLHLALGVFGRLKDNNSKPKEADACLVGLVSAIAKYSGSQYDAIKNKYSRQKYDAVSLIHNIGSKLLV